MNSGIKGRTILRTRRYTEHSPAGTLRAIGLMARAIWLRIPFAWSLQITLADRRRRRSLRATRSSWLGNEAQPSTIESSYLLLRTQSRDGTALKRDMKGLNNADYLSRAEGAARRTH